PLRRRAGAAVHGAGTDLGDAQYDRRFRGGDDGLKRACEPVAPTPSVSAPEAGFGVAHRRARDFAGAGAAAGELAQPVSPPSLRGAKRRSNPFFLSAARLLRFACNDVASSTSPHAPTSRGDRL